MDEIVNNRGSQAVRRVLRILQCWNDSPTMTLTQVAKVTGLTMPTAHRMIRALQDEDFLVQDTVTGSYSLGPSISQLTRVMLHRSEQDELALVAMPHMERMRSITRETVGLHLPMAESRICVAELVSRQPMRSATGVGGSFLLPAGAAGKVLVAWSPERLAMATDEFSAADRKLLDTEVARIVAQGYATSMGETIPGASGLALPVFVAGGSVVGAINITGPEQRWSKTRMRETLPELREEMAQISLQLGYREGREAGQRPSG